MKSLSSSILLVTVSTLVVIATSGVVFVEALNNGAGLVPPLGISTWGEFGSAWRDVCTEDGLKQTVRAMKANGMFQLGYRTLQIDDCWSACWKKPRGKNESITWDTERFPSGMPNFVEWMHKEGMKVFLYESIGNTSCSSGGRRGCYVPGAQNHIEQDVHTMAVEWNADGSKMDLCGDSHKFPGILEAGGWYKEYSKAVLKLAKPFYYMAVGGIFTLLGDVTNVVNSWRGTTDHHDDWSNSVGVMATVATNIEPRGRPGSWPTLDVLFTGGEGCKNQSHYNSSKNGHCPGQTDLNYIATYSVWSVFQSPIFIASDVINLVAIQQRLLFNKKILEMHQDTSTPPGKYIGGDKKCALLETIGCSFWLRIVRDQTTKQVGVWLVLLNIYEQPQKIEFDFEENKKHLPDGWNSTTTVNVDDLWNSQKYNDNFPSDSVLASLSKQDRESWEVKPGIFEAGATGKFSALVREQSAVAVLMTKM